MLEDLERQSLDGGAASSPGLDAALSLGVAGGVGRLGETWLEAMFGGFLGLVAGAFFASDFEGCELHLELEELMLRVGGRHGDGWGTGLGGWFGGGKIGNGKFGNGLGYLFRPESGIFFFRCSRHGRWWKLMSVM